MFNYGLLQEYLDERLCRYTIVEDGNAVKLYTDRPLRQYEIINIRHKLPFSSYLYVKRLSWYQNRINKVKIKRVK